MKIKSKISQLEFVIIFEQRNSFDVVDSRERRVILGLVRHRNKVKRKLENPVKKKKTKFVFFVYSTFYLV